jgi:hypothetical protein
MWEMSYALYAALPKHSKMRGQTMAQKPTRQRKDDRLLHPAATAEQIRCDAALGPFDTAVRAMDRKWGVDRLMEIVSPESADKWARAMAGLNESIQNDDPDKTRAWVEVCLRGLKAMDDEAVALGRQVSDPDILEYEYEGTVFGIISDGREWPAAYDKRPGLTIYTLREVAIALKAHKNELVNAVKMAFPGAEIKAIRRKPEDLEDKIDFGAIEPSEDN